MKALLNKILEKVGLRQDPVKHARKLGVQVGDDCRFIQIKSFGSEPYLVRIGNHVSLTAVTFITHDGATWVIRDQERYKKVHKFGAITIKDNSFVGHGTVILPGVTIGPNSIVGACSLVTKDVPPNTVWGGCSCT